MKRNCIFVGTGPCACPTSTPVLVRTTTGGRTTQKGCPYEIIISCVGADLCPPARFILFVIPAHAGGNRKVDQNQSRRGS